MNTVINSRADLDAAKVSNPDRYAAFITALKGACVVQTDTAKYPEGYDRTKQPKDEGYVAPQIVDVPTNGPAERFGFTRDELMGM